MNKFSIQEERITKYNPLYLFYLAKLSYFESIFQSPFMSITFLILHRGSLFVLSLFLYFIFISLFNLVFLARQKK